MKISSQLKGGIYEVSFRYHSKLDGYATLMSDIPTLGEMAKVICMKQNYGLIYKVTNRINGKVYIGQTIQSLKYRKKDHLNSIERLNHIVFYRALKRYGKGNFSWEVLEYAKTKEELDEKERYYIELYKSMNPRKGYNMTYGGEGGEHPPEIRAKISDSLKGRIVTEETRKKLSISLKGKYTGEKASWWGKKHTDEERRKIGEAQIGTKNHMYGKKASETTRQK